jgi:hypothetical protein
MSDTAQLFILAGVWTLISFFVASRIANWPARIVALVLLVGIPFWELPFGYYYFRELCKNEAKLLVFEAIIPQDSVCVENLDSGLYSNLVKAGFPRIEVSGSSDDQKRDAASGRVFRVRVEDGKSRYCLHSQSNVTLPWRVLRHDTVVASINDGHAIARQSRFHWSGMWWQQAAQPILGRGGRCFDDPTRLMRFVRTGSG